jgi:hypothetical protein
VIVGQPDVILPVRGICLGIQSYTILLVTQIKKYIV